MLANETRVSKKPQHQDINDFTMSGPTAVTFAVMLTAALCLALGAIGHRIFQRYRFSKKPIECSAFSVTTATKIINCEENDIGVNEQNDKFEHFKSLLHRYDSQPFTTEDEALFTLNVNNSTLQLFVIPSGNISVKFERRIFNDITTDKSMLFETLQLYEFSDKFVDDLQKVSFNLQDFIVKSQYRISVCRQLNDKKTFNEESSFDLSAFYDNLANNYLPIIGLCFLKRMTVIELITPTRNRVRIMRSRNDPFIPMKEVFSGVAKGTVKIKHNENGKFVLMVWDLPSKCCES